MIRLLADENFDADITRGLLRRLAGLDLALATLHGLEGAPDPDVLAWAARHGRIVLTHDRATMPAFGHRRWLEGEPLPGIWVVDDGMAKGAAIDQLALAISCLEPEECKDKILYFPLR